MPKFKIGDKIVINDNVNPNWWFKPGQKGVIIELNDEARIIDEQNLNITFEGVDVRFGNNLKRRGFITEDMADLEMDQVREAPMGNFVFCSEGGKYYERGSYTSLALAEARAQQLRGFHGTANIYPFVMVK